MSVAACLLLASAGASGCASNNPGGTVPGSTIEPAPDGSVTQVGGSAASDAATDTSRSDGAALDAGNGTDASASGGDATISNDAGDASVANDATVGNDASDAMAAGADSGAVDSGSDAGSPADGSVCISSACASGACTPDGGCLPACSSANPCLGTLSCCSGQCVDPARDPRNCGSCGNACSIAQFCTSQSCADTIMSNVCGNAKAVAIEDGLDGDDLASKVLGAALAACVRPVNVRYASQDAGDLDPTTHAPRSGPGETSAVAGGAYGQQLMGYMNLANEPVIPSADSSNVAFVLRATGADVIRVPVASITPAHDYFLLSLATDPASGTLVVSSSGFLANGTAAGAYYFANVIMPSVATFGMRWYVFEWTASASGPDAGGGPSATDTFRPVASGM